MKKIFVLSSRGIYSCSHQNLKCDYAERFQLTKKFFTRNYLKSNSINEILELTNLINK